MYSNSKLKKLAKLVSISAKIDDDLKKFILEVLNKKDLKTFLHFYRVEMQKKNLTIYSAFKLEKSVVDEIIKNYPDMNLTTVIDRTLGGGIKLQNNDLVIDFTVKNYINDTIEKLKN